MKLAAFLGSRKMKELLQPEADGKSDRRRTLADKQSPKPDYHHVSGDQQLLMAPTVNQLC
jgi:hypothetical protein